MAVAPLRRDQPGWASSEGPGGGAGRRRLAVCCTSFSPVHCRFEATGVECQGRRKDEDYNEMMMQQEVLTAGESPSNGRCVAGQLPSRGSQDPDHCVGKHRWQDLDSQVDAPGGGPGAQDGDADLRGQKKWDGEGGRDRSEPAVGRATQGTERGGGGSSVSQLALPATASGQNLRSRPVTSPGA